MVVFIVVRWFGFSQIVSVLDSKAAVLIDGGVWFCLIVIDDVLLCLMVVFDCSHGPVIPLYFVESRRFPRVVWDWQHKVLPPGELSALKSKPTRGTVRLCLVLWTLSRVVITLSMDTSPGELLYIPDNSRVALIFSPDTSPGGDSFILSVSANPGKSPWRHRAHPSGFHTKIVNLVPCKISLVYQ